MTITIKLAVPIERDGRRYTEVRVRRPGLIAFSKYWRRRLVDDVVPAGMLSVPRAVADALHPADHRRLIEAMMRVSAPFVWAIAIWQIIFKGSATARHLNSEN